LLKTHKNKKQNKFIVSERHYIGITATINDFRSTLASCEVPPLRVRAPSPNIHRKAGEACVARRGLLEVADLDDEEEEEEEEEEERGI
jgi:hypothetical protein